MNPTFSDNLNAISQMDVHKIQNRNEQDLIGPNEESEDSDEYDADWGIQNTKGFFIGGKNGISSSRSPKNSKTIQSKNSTL